MRFKSVLYYSPAEIINIYKNINQGERLNTVLLEKHTKIWPYEKCSVSNWSNVINAAKTRLTELAKLYFVPKKKNNTEYEINEYIQQKPITADDKNEIVIILLFLESLFENTTGRTQININDTLCFFAYCIEFEVSLRALYLMRMIMHKQYRSVIFKYNKKMTNLFMFMQSVGNKKVHKISSINFAIDTDDIFELNQKLKNTQVNESDYVKMLIDYKQAKDGENYRCLQYLIADLFLYSRSPDTHHNTSLADMLSKSYSYTNTKNYAVKRAIYDFYIACMEKRYKVKYIYDGLRVRLYDGEFMTELRSVYTKEKPFVKTFFAFITTCLTSKNDALNFITEIGILGIFRDLLNVPMHKEFEIGTVTMKMSISRIIAMILENRYLLLSHTFYENNFHEIFFDEIVLCIDSVPKQDYKKRLTDGTVFDCQVMHCYMSYLRYLLLCIDSFYSLIQTHGSEFDIVDLLESKFLSSMRYMLENNTSFSCEILNHLFSIITNYINAHPLNIVIFEEKDILGILLKVYTNLPKSSSNIIHLIDILNGLSLRTEYLDLIIEKNILRSISMTLLDQNYLECFTITDISSQLGISFEELLRHHPKFKVPIFEECIFLLDQLSIMEGSDKFTRKTIIDELFKQGETYNITNYAKEVSTMIPYQEFTKNVLLFLDSLILVDTFSGVQINQIIAKILDLITKETFYYDFDFDFIDLFNSIFGKSKGFDIQDEVYMVLADKLQNVIIKIDVEQIAIVQSLAKEHYSDENKTDKDKPDDLPDSFYDYMHNYIITNRILSLLVQVVDEHQPFTTKNAMPKILLAIFSVEQIFYAFTKYNQIIYFENKPDTYIDESSAHTIKNSMFDFSNEVRYTMLIYRMRNNMAILFFAHIRMLKQREPFQMLIKYVFRFTQFGNENNELKNEKLANDYLLLCFIGNLIENKNASIFSNYIEQLIDYIGSFIENIRVEPEESQLMTKYYDKNDKVIDLRDIKKLNEKLVEVYFYIFKLLMENEMFRLTDKDTERILEYTYKLINMIDCKAYSSEIQKILIFHINDSTKTGLSYESFTKENLELKNHEKVYLSFLAQKYTNDSIFYSKRYYDYLFSINGYKVVNEMQKKNIAGFFAIAQNFKNLGDRTETNAKELRFYKTDFSNEVTNMSDTETEKQEMIVVNILIFYFLCTSYNFDMNTSYKVQEQQKNDQKGNLDRIEKILGAFSSDGADKKRLNFKYKPLQKETSDEVTENMTEKHQNLFDQIYCYNDIYKMTEFACKFTVAEKLLENLNFIIVILRLIEGNIVLLTKSELFDMIDFNNLFAQVKQKQCSKTDTLLQLLIFYFAENEGFLTKVVRKIKKTKANLVAHKNILQYRCYPIIKQEMSNDTEEIPCNHTITEEQYKIINLLKSLILSVEYSALALQIFSHLIIYFPYFSAELKEKKFWHKYFNRLVKKEVDKNEINDQNRYGWAVNFAAAIFLRTNNTTVKKIITDTIIKNLTGNNAKNVNYMCKFMTGMLNSKVIINEYACDKECLIKIKPEVPIHETTTQRATTPVTRRRNSQVHSQDLNIEVTEILDELAGRIDSSFSDRIQLVDEPMTPEEQNRLFTRFRSNKPEPINASGSQIVEVFFEKKIPDILLQAIQTSETIPNIVSLLDILSKLRNTNERIDDSDSDLIEFHDSESTTVSEGNEFEDFSAEEEDSEFEDDEEMIDEENEYEDTSLDYYLFDNKPVPSILQRECKFTNLLELWAHEFSTLLKVNEVYFIDELAIDNTIIDFDTTQKVATSTTVTESTDSGNSQEAIVRLPIVANSLVAEEEVCTYQDGCTCIDCISQQSSESSVGEFDGITPELDPVVLNDLPENLLHEIISNYYDERRTVSTDYQPININFLLTLNDRVRNLFEEYELRFRDDYLLDEKKDEHIIDIPELKIRDKQPIIDTQYIDSILKIVQHDLTQKTGLSLLNNICSNANIRKNVMKRLIKNLRRDSENSSDDALNSIVNTLKMLGSLLKHQNDYIIYLNVQDINLIFNCGYGKHFSKIYQVLGDILLLITGYDTMKVILQNKELSIEARMKCECTRSLEREKKKAELKESENDCANVLPENRRIEFTDDSNLISIERYYLDTIDLKAKENEKLNKYLSDINFESDVSFYLPNTNVSLSYASDYATMNIMDSNISYFYAKHLQMQYMLSCIEQTTNRDILDYFENIILCTENTFALQYIEFIFTQILAIIDRFDFYFDFYNDLNTLYFYFNVISQIRITFNRKEVLEDPQYTISHYFNDCKLAYDNFREKIQKHVFWQSFFVFLETHKEYTMSLMNIFECFCILRKLRYDEDEYKAIVNGDEMDEETQSVVNIQENTDVHSGLTLNADSKSNKNTITDNTFDSDNAIKRLKLDAGTKNDDNSGTIEFNNFFRSKVMDYAAFFNRAFEGNISTISKTCDIIPYYNILEFDNKRKYLKHVFKKHGISTIYINVDRNNLVEDSYTQIMNKSGKELRIGKLLVKFSDEEGVDVGGLTREFYMLISKEIVNPDYYLFTQNQDGRTYSINKSSHVNAEHLLFFRFVGRIIAKGIIDNILTDIHFTVPFYKQILGKKLTLSDLMQVDLSFYKSLKWMQENAIEGVVDCSFSLEYDEFGVAKTYDLIENGRNIKVDDNNKHEYIELMANFHMTKNCEKQVQSFNQGFYEVLEKKYVKVFNEKELELLISGLPEIDVDDWRNNTEYHGYKSSSLEIQWFWRCVRGMNNEDKARLLQFVTGTSKLPIEGFKALQGNNGRQRFQIHVGNRGLPCAHTCFNQLDLPKYKNYEEMVDNLLYAIRECSTGFGFA